MSGVAEALERIAARDGALNCFTDVYTDARETGADGPLANIPFAVKDLYDISGRVTKAGSVIYADNPPARRDATVITRLKKAGGVPVGTTNMDEFAFGFTSENPHNGPTRNPHDQTRIVGGSSGGSAAAVAADLVPLALGSDTNGSVRVPAALCGVFGFKPTYGRLSRAGVAPLAWSFDHVGVFARDMKLIATAFDAMQGADEGDPACTELAPAPSLPSLMEGVDGLRIAVADGHFATGGLAEVFAATAGVADGLGADRRIDIPDAHRSVAAALLITSAEAACLHLDEIRTRAEDFDPHTRDRWIAATLIPSAWIHRAQRFRRTFRDRVLALFDDIDLLITPTTAFPAPEIGQGLITIDGKEVPTRGMLGVQIVGAPHCDALVLRAAAALQAKGATLT